MKKLINTITACEKMRKDQELKCSQVRDELIQYFDFEIDSDVRTLKDFFHVEYQPSDGWVLGDDETYVYHLTLIITHIKENGKIKSLSFLRRQFSI